jgi:MFS family permease
MRETPRLFYGYILVAFAIGIQIVAWGTYNSFGVFFNPLLAEFEWSRATLSGAASLAQMMVGVGAIFFGRLSDKFNPRLLVAGGGILASLGYFLMSRLNSVWELYLFYGVIAGIGLSGIDIILLSTTARWFIKRRGMMSGIVKMGTGIGILVMPVLLNFFISSYQWRTAFVITACIMASCLVLGAQFLVKDPSQKQQFPDGQKPANRLNNSPENMSLSLGEAIRTRRFLTLCLAYFTVFFCTSIMVVHIVRYTIDLGHTASSGALVLAVIGGASIAGRFIMGTIGDKTGSKYALLVCLAVFVLVFIWLQFAHQLWQLFFFAVAYGFGHGGFYALISPAVAEFFGIRSHGVILGSIVFVSSIGGALGPVVAGYIFDVSSSYHIAFLLLLAFSALGFITILVSGSRKKEAVAPDEV